MSPGLLTGISPETRAVLSFDRHIRIRGSRALDRSRNPAVKIKRRVWSGKARRASKLAWRWRSKLRQLVRRTAGSAYLIVAGVVLEGVG